MKCEVGSCQAKATFTIDRVVTLEDGSIGCDSSITCGRHVASELAAMVQAYGAVTVTGPVGHPHDHAEPRSQPGGTSGGEEDRSPLTDPLGGVLEH